jgi:hypothetical protein
MWRKIRKKSCASKPPLGLPPKIKAVSWRLFVNIRENGPQRVAEQCLPMRLERTCRTGLPTSEFDPERLSLANLLCAAKFFFLFDHLIGAPQDR